MEFTASSPSAFTLLILRYIRPTLIFNERLMKHGFWWLDAGLVLMLFTSVLPVGLIQFGVSASEGLWYARSEAFMQQPLLETLRWIRTFGDVVSIAGALMVAWQVVYGIFFHDPRRTLQAGGGLTEAAPVVAGAAAIMESTMHGDSVCCGHCGGKS